MTLGGDHVRHRQDLGEPSDLGTAMSEVCPCKRVFDLPHQIPKFAPESCEILYFASQWLNALAAFALDVVHGKSVHAPPGWLVLIA